ncbi:MAG: hypothetical protein RLZZ292_1960, partial [Bacteroidota bacterium]
MFLLRNSLSFPTNVRDKLRRAEVGLNLNFFMNTNKINLSLSVAALLVIIAAVSRLMPHILNFSSVGAMALFGGAYFSRRSWAFFLPFAAMWASDLFLNNTIYRSFYPDTVGTVWYTSPWIYGAFALMTVLGMTFLKEINVKNVVLTSLTG